MRVCNSGAGRYIVARGPERTDEIAACPGADDAQCGRRGSARLENAVGDFVHRTIAPHSHQVTVAVSRRVAGDLNGVPCAFGELEVEEESDLLQKPLNIRPALLRRPGASGGVDDDFGPG